MVGVVEVVVHVVVVVVLVVGLVVVVVVSRSVSSAHNDPHEREVRPASDRTGYTAIASNPAYTENRTPSTGTGCRRLTSRRRSADDGSVTMDRKLVLVLVANVASGSGSSVST